MRRAWRGIGVRAGLAIALAVAAAAAVPGGRGSGSGAAVPARSGPPVFDHSPSDVPIPGPKADRRAAREALRRGGDRLWRFQAADGGWHSPLYGLLRSGQAYTPFALHALLEIPEDIVLRPVGGVERALAFIRNHLDARGALGAADPDIVEYPNYATASALRCAVRAGRSEDAALVARMRAYLVLQQFGTGDGFGAGDPAWGGWGFGGTRRPGAPGHLDVAHTRRVLQALREAGGVGPPVFERAFAFLARVQRLPAGGHPQPPYDEDPDRAVPFDGGFYYSPLVLAANKGRLAPASPGAGAHYRSYATATCDGVLALVAAGAPEDDPRVVAARRWLEAHPRLDRPEGIPEEYPEPWGEALRFYHFAVRAEAYDALGVEGEWREDVVRRLIAVQAPDGAFRNDASHLMKEDDPVLATTLAVITLTRAVH